VKECIISCGVGGWYPKGIDRMGDSLKKVEFKGDFVGMKELPKGSPTHQENPYAFKIYAIKEAVRFSYKKIMWCDCSLYAVKNPLSLFHQNIFGFHTGFNVANTATDVVLNETGLTRDEAEMIPEIATGCIGLDFNTQIAKKAFNLWADYMKAGLFKNSRYHSGQSKDKRFMFARQDQTMWSIALHKLGVSLPQTDNVIYHESPNKKNAIFIVHGL
jgi:hypothetical protein